jgi:hypothetical protein
MRLPFQNKAKRLATTLLLLSLGAICFLPVIMWGAT